MKVKVLIFSVLALLPLISVAQRITDAQAMSIAESVLGKQVAKAVPARTMHAPAANGSEIAQPFYDIFTGEDGNGFVIVSTDRRAPRIIGYGDGICDPNNLPPQLAYILNKQDSLLAVDSSLGEHPSWMQRAPRLLAAGEGGKVNVTAAWGQDFPFNEKTPEINGQHAVTGCVATAMSIVMKYNRWPETYNWDAMPDQPTAGTSYPELAQLMADAGESVYMNYGLNESGASTSWAPHKLQARFQYSPECQYISKDNFDEDVWVSMLRGEIDKDRVTIYAGGGHAYIVDGYDSTGLFHVNWGWAGYCNGYFPINQFKPQYDNFSENATMIINITPDETGKDKAGRPYSENFVDNGYFWADRGAFSGCMVDCDKLENGKSFNFICYFYNLVPGFVGEVGLALMDENDNIKGDILKRESVTTWSEWDNQYVLSGHDLRLLNVTIPEGIEIKATDRLQVVSKAEGTDQWLIMPGTIEAPSYLKVSDVKASVSEVHLTVTGTDLVSFYGYTATSVPGKIGPRDETSSFLTGGTIFCQSYKYDHPEATIRITTINPNGEAEVVTNVGTTTAFFSLNAGRYEIIVEEVEAEPQDETTWYEGVEYRINEDYADVVGFDPSYSTEPIIEAEISYNGTKYPVTEIADYAFENTTLTQCHIYADLTRIGEKAFANCASLIKVVLWQDETPAELHSSAFEGVNVSKVYVNVPLTSYLTYKDTDNWKALNLVPLYGTLALNDQIEYLIDKDVYGCTLSYTRTVTTDNWMGVYLPFEINVTAVPGTYATLEGVSSDGVLEWTIQDVGTIAACTPFIFKPEAAGEVTFNVSSSKLNSCKTANPVSINGYKLEGNFQTKEDMALINGYALYKGNFYRTSDVTKTLKPYRIFLTVPSSVLQTKAPVRCRIDGMDVTAIEDIMIDSQSTNDKPYNLKGIQVDSDYNGVVIFNGKKVIRK